MINNLLIVMLYNIRPDKILILYPRMKIKYTCTVRMMKVFEHNNRYKSADIPTT